MEYDNGVAAKMESVPTEEAVSEADDRARDRTAEILVRNDGRYKYDPIARYYYPPPYPREQGHGSGA